MKIDSALLTLVALLIAALVVAFWKGRWQLVWTALKQTGRNFRLMWFRILLGITFGGLIQVLVPKDLIAQWLGPASGLKGILIGSYVGLFVSGGPYVILPVIASIYNAGAGPAQVIALLAGGMLHVQGVITWNIPFFGLRLSLAEYLISLVLPPLIGIAGGALYQLLNIA
ncbi:MAG: permease [Chloroflexi bacterium]|nr:permease [Chloroflexota bacterium]MBI4267734.1 permease [Chloroflexota bacterium]